jgi:hypothetical protein
MQQQPDQRLGDRGGHDPDEARPGPFFPLNIDGDDNRDGSQTRPVEAGSLWRVRDDGLADGGQMDALCLRSWAACGDEPVGLGPRGVRRRRAGAISR